MDQPGKVANQARGQLNREQYVILEQVSCVALQYMPSDVPVCMVIAHSMDQPGKVANQARGQLNRENGYFPVPVRA